MLLIQEVLHKYHNQIILINCRHHKNNFKLTKAISDLTGSKAFGLGSTVRNFEQAQESVNIENLNENLKTVMDKIINTDAYNNSSPADKSKIDNLCLTLDQNMDTDAASDINKAVTGNNQRYVATKHFALGLNQVDIVNQMNIKPMTYMTGNCQQRL
jgi:hypothetical protein